MVICIIYSRLWTLIGPTFADAGTEIEESLNERTAHSQRGRRTLGLASSRAHSGSPSFLPLPYPGPLEPPLAPAALSDGGGHFPETLLPLGTRSLKKEITLSKAQSHTLSRGLQQVQTPRQHSNPEEQSGCGLRPALEDRTVPAPGPPSSTSCKTPGEPASFSEAILSSTIRG
ncbi:uncharacterized protein LOC144579063 [Callithrix jacchus]